MDSEKKSFPTVRSNTTESETSVVDEEFLGARELINLFIKTIKAFRLYPGDNPTLIGMQEQLFKRFQTYLEMYNSFELEIGEHDFSFKGRILYEDWELKGSLPFLFFKDGLRKFRFLEGIEEWEVKDLTDIIIQRDKVNEIEDDLLTLIWEKDFLHISYSATDPFIEETAVSIPETADQFRKSMTSEPLPASARAELEEEASRGEFALDQEIGEGEKGRARERAGAYSLSPEELDALHEEVERELNPNFAFQVVDVIFEILVIEKESEPYEDAIRSLGKVLDAQLTVGEFEKARDLLNRIHSLLSTHPISDWQSQKVEHFMESLGDAQHTQRIGGILEKRTDLRLEEVSAYLLLLRPNSVPGLIKVLGELTNSKGRRMLCDVVCGLGRTRIDLITPYLEDARWYLVRNLIYILGRIGEESSMPHILKGYNHDEARVRREAVQAAGLIGGSQAVGLLTKALKDPDLRIRSMAGINLARVGKKASLLALLEVVQAKDFSKRDPSEIKAFFDAVGSIGSNDAIGPLQKILEHKSWFGGGGKNESRLGAACALALIGTPEARAVLEAGANARNESIQQACREAKRQYGI